jgi:hypothetical protein
LDPVAAFMLFNTARNDGLLPYLGVSFYTKVLFFFFPGSPAVEAPILDQFCAKSINALFTPPVVRMWGNMPAVPTDSGKAAVMYRQYLECLDVLRTKIKARIGMSFSRSQVEWLLFRKEEGSWREVVTAAASANKVNNGGGVKSC